MVEVSDNGDRGATEAVPNSATTKNNKQAALATEAVSEVANMALNNTNDKAQIKAGKTKAGATDTVAGSATNNNKNTNKIETTLDSETVVEVASTASSARTDNKKQSQATMQSRVDQNEFANSFAKEN